MAEVHSQKHEFAIMIIQSTNYFSSLPVFIPWNILSNQTISHSRDLFYKFF